MSYFYLYVYCSEQERKGVRPCETSMIEDVYGGADKNTVWGWMFGNHVPDGGNVLFRDWHVTWAKSGRENSWIYENLYRP